MKYIMLFLPVLFVIPLSVRADIVPLPDSLPSFTEASLLTLAIQANGAEITDQSTTTLPIAEPLMFTYNIGYKNGWFFNDALTDEERESIFASTLEERKIFLTLWRGEPLTTSAELVGSWDVSGARSGNLVTSIPEDGRYFFLLDMPNYVLRDPDGVCAQVGDPVELCLPQTTLGMSVEESWAYVRTPEAAISFGEGVYTSMGFGGVRFVNETGAPPPMGASSILFLPGIQGSRLYEDTVLPGGLGIENQRWELTPGMSQGDAEALYFNPDGTSRRHIYTKANAAVATADLPFVGFDVYRSFFEKLEKLKLEGTIQDFRAFPYDWRKSPVDIIENGTFYNQGTRFATDAVEELAAESHTGKVTIVGHSNGGLVAKALMRRLEREGKAHLVDTVMFVGVPHLGTPQTLVPMLHGDYGKLTSFGGLYLSKPNARQLVEYMPDAFALLPSSAYFEKVDDPVINLEQAPELAQASGVPATVSSALGLDAFLTGNGRAKPGATDIETPNTLSASLLNEAKSVHADLDMWVPPAGVQVVQIAGWGMDTPKGVRYVEKKVRTCTLLIFSCKDVTKLTHAAEFTADGDGTVVGVSQVPEHASPTYYVDLAAANATLKKNWRHANIAESEPFQELFASLIASSTQVSMPEFVTQSAPPTSSRLRLRVLSPATLEAYDAEGRHTGLVASPEGSDLLYKEEQIPNSYYEEFGEGKYLGLPAAGSTTVRLKGLASGTFTYEVALVDGEQVQTVTYTDVPVTASTTATMAIKDDNLEQLTLVLDTNGDGKADTTLTPGGSTTPLAHVRHMRTAVMEMELAPAPARQLTAKLTNLENLLLKNGKWDDADDDDDRQEMRREGALKKKVLRKVDKIEGWIRKQLQKDQPSPKKPSTLPRLTPQQAQTLLDMLGRLKGLLS